MRVRMRWVDLLIALLLIVIVAAVVGALNRHHQARKLERFNACAEQLLAISLKLWHRFPGEQYPRLSTTPGRLMFDADSVYPTPIDDSSVLISRAHAQAGELLQQAQTNPVSVIDDHSYWYLGYTIMTERTLRSFIDAYKASIETGEPIPEINEVWEHTTASLDGGADTNSPAPTGGALRHRARIGDWPPPEHERNFRMILKNDIEMLLVRKKDNPAAGAMILSRIPLLIERPELHGNGGHVLFLDGHVEFIPYPGKFPMTEAFIAGLRELDALGDADL